MLAANPSLWLRQAKGATAASLSPAKPFNPVK
jgi:hypothetical protein